MRQPRTSGWVAALLGLLWATAATGCGSVQSSPVAAAARAPAAAAASGSVPAAERSGKNQPAAASRENPVTAKEHGIMVPGKSANVVTKRSDLLNAVSCASRRCVAVGAYYRGTRQEHTLAESLSGRNWSQLPSPDGPRDSSLSGVSCVSVAGQAADGAAGCLAVGSPVLADVSGQWRMIARTSDLNAVSCTGADTCMAVGWTAHALVFGIWDGRTLRRGTMHAPPPEATEAAISGVSCTAADNCVAVGDYSYGQQALGDSPGFRDKTLAEQWNGHSWRLLPTVDVSRSDLLTAVSCASAADCTAIGASQRQYPLAEHWNGGSWRVEPMPAVSVIGYTQLTGVSCPAAGFCAASGSYQGQPVAEIWTGAKWRVTLLPQPPADNHSARLNGVSCTSPAACVAVGTSGGANGYAELYTGGKWRLSATRNPA